MEGEGEVLVTEMESTSGGHPITCGLKDLLPDRVLARPGPCPWGACSVCIPREMVIHENVGSHQSPSPRRPPHTGTKLTQTSSRRDSGLLVIASRAPENKTLYYVLFMFLFYKLNNLQLLCNLGSFLLLICCSFTSLLLKFREQSTPRRPVTEPDLRCVCSAPTAPW